MHRPRLSAIPFLLLACICVVPAAPSAATTAIPLRSRYRVVLAADSRAIYTGSMGTECKLFEIRNVYATVSGLAHYGTGFRSTDAIWDGFSRPGSFENHVSATAFSLQQRVQRLLAGLQRANPQQYQYLMQRTGGSSDFVELALAQSINGQPMLGIIELQRVPGQNGFAARITICPSNCRQGDGIFYLGYWERIRPYVANSGQPRNIGSAASLDRLIRLEIDAHPAEVGAPINILELNGSGARWLQNGGTCSLPGVSW